MELEELKIEAAKLGYDLVKKRPYVKLLPCTCGKKHPSQWYTFGGTQFYRCNNCELESPAAKTNVQARKNWNNFINSKST